MDPSGGSLGGQGHGHGHGHGGFSARYRGTLLAAAAGNAASPSSPLLRFVEAAEATPSLYKEVRSDGKQGLFHLAALEGSDDVLRLLLRSPTLRRHLGDRDSARRTPLHLAAALGQASSVVLLLEATADVGLRDERGQTALHLATRFNWPSAVSLLLLADADPLQEDAAKKNAVDIAAFDPLVGPEVRSLLSPFEGERRRGPKGMARVLPWPPWKLRKKPSNRGLDEAGGRSMEPSSTLRTDSAPSTGPGTSVAAASSTGSWAGSSRASDAFAASGEQAFLRLHAYFGRGCAKLGLGVRWGNPPIVTHVAPDSPAALSGLEPGDRLVELNGTAAAARSRSELLRMLHGHRPLQIKADRLVQPTAAEAARGIQLHLQPPLSEPAEAEGEEAVEEGGTGGGGVDVGAGAGVGVGVGGGAELRRPLEAASRGLRVSWQSEEPVVDEVLPGSTGWALGLLEGDVITAVSARGLPRLSGPKLCALICSEPLRPVSVRRPVRRC